MPRPRWTPILAGSILFMRCASDQRLDLRGPLVEYASWLPSLAASCTALRRTYAAPFHVAPYRSCHHDDGLRLTSIEIDAEGTVVEVHEISTVPATHRQAVFDSVAAILTERLGQPTVCAPSALWWSQQDSVQAALRLRPTGDAWPEAETRDWRLSKIVRYCPLPDAFTCRLSETEPAA
jgi:hypothetical protein